MGVGDEHQRLAKFHTAYAAIDQVDTPPKTTLEILKKHYDENYWNRFLKYFLDPTKPHGFETTVLRHFLELLERRCSDFDFDRYCVDEVRVDREVGTPSDNRADIVLRYETEWFVWIEMKVRATEGDRQTDRYVRDEYVGDVRKSEFDERNQFYVYLAPEGNEANASEFVNLDWSSVVDDLRSIQQTGSKEQPFRSYAQFVDFLDTIHNETQMTKHEEDRQEKVQLAIEYYDSIRDVDDAFEKVLKEHKEEWPVRFEPYAPESWKESWHYHTGKKKLTFYKRSWTVAYVQQDEDVDASDPLRPYFQHVMSKDRIANNELYLKTQLTGSDSRLRQDFQDYVYNIEVQERLQKMATKIEERPGCEVQLPSRDDRTYTRFTKATYPIEWKNGEGYYGTLEQALEDHREVMRIFSEAVDYAND
ncbi:PD-(D/E)XK nuclease family protein [Natronococcus wangiae]|uniref:PD-(D/E)XK nuclease family protein n=1 Tax=Natronococcus wangiae TaxID=3068275 RepID=UPI00273F4A3A|nr:PD-(D/E)XK nuclease family protein [Natronococcus sp. AD5]